MKLLLSCLLTLFWPFALHAASFDCTKAATQVEQIICKNDSLSELDGLLAKAYTAALSKQSDPDAFKTQQRVWLRDTRDLCKDATCLLKAYTSRLAALSGACEFFGKFNSAVKWEELRSLNVDNQLGEICLPKYPACRELNITLDALSEMGLPSNDKVLAELLRGQSYYINVSLVDIDNDGVDDLRLYITGGSLHCTSSYFFKKTPEGKFKPVLSGGYDVLRGEYGRFCGGSDLLFVRHDGMLYAVDRSDEHFHKVDTVWIGSANHLYELCRWR